jgi:hypothetical protein
LIDKIKLRLKGVKKIGITIKIISILLRNKIKDAVKDVLPVAAVLK